MVLDTSKHCLDGSSLANLGIAAGILVTLALEDQ
jgi:hypothetical protein